MTKDRVLIGELARKAGLSAKTVRYYEELGLLEAAERTESGYRTYSERDVERVMFIQGAKALGLSLAEIKGVVGMIDTGGQPCAEVSQLLDHKIADMDRKIAQFTRFRDELRAYKAKMDAAPPAGPSACRHVQGVRTGEWDPSNSAPAEPLSGRCASDRNTGPRRPFREPSQTTRRSPCGWSLPDGT